MKDKDKENFFDKFLKSERNKRIIIIAGILGIALIFVSGFFDSGTKKEDPEILSGVLDVSQATASFKESTEKNLQDIISKIEGVGWSEVLITLDSTAEYVYAVDEKTNIKEDSGSASDSSTLKSDQNFEKNYITVRLSDGTEQAIVLKQIEPKIRGVLVVCDGAGDPRVSATVLEAVTKSLGVSTTKVCIAPLSESSSAVARSSESVESFD